MIFKLFNEGLKTHKCRATSVIVTARPRECNHFNRGSVPLFFPRETLCEPCYRGRHTKITGG